MPLYKFKEGDVLRNRIKSYPKNYFLITSDGVVYNKLNPTLRIIDPGALSYIKHVEKGHVSLYEFNVDRPADGLIHPFIEKSSNLVGFKTTMSSSSGILNERNGFSFDNYGDNLSFRYPLSSSISFEYIPQSDTGGTNNTITGRNRIFALRNTLDFYKTSSPHYSYNSTHGNKSTQDVNLISVPSIFYGSSIRKGSVKLSLYVSGSLVGELTDSGKNGELRQVLPANSDKGKVAGVVLYNEGFVLLTGSWDLHSSHTEAYTGGSGIAPKWKFWGGNYSSTPSSSWGIEFEGVNYTPVVTMLAHAPRGALNHSNNPTFVKHSTSSSGVLTEHTTHTSKELYLEDAQKPIANIVSSSYSEPSASFKKQTYISKIGIYDENKNLIAVAKVATPVKKTEEREYTFKLKLDI